MSLAVGLPVAVAHDRDDASMVAQQPPVTGRIGRQSLDWGGVDLKALAPATLAVTSNDPASPPEAKLSPDEVRFGDRAVRRSTVETILRAAKATGVDPVYMMALADKESSFRHEVRSSASSAQGLFQFITGTWLEMIRDHGAKHGLVAEAAAIQGRGAAMRVTDAAARKRILDLRNDPYISGLMAGELIKRDRAKIEARIGRELKTTELYLAHFLGTANAGKFLSLSASSPDADANREFSGAARANRTIFTANADGKRRRLTVAEVHGRLDEMIDRRMDAYQDVLELAAQTAEQERMGDLPLIDARLRVMGAVPMPSTSAVQ